MKKRTADLTPTAKVTAATLGSAVATLVVFIAVKTGLDMSSEETLVVTGALATVFTFVAGWFAPE